MSDCPEATRLLSKCVCMFVCVFFCVCLGYIPPDCRGVVRICSVARRVRHFHGVLEDMLLGRRDRPSSDWPRYLVRQANAHISYHCCCASVMLLVRPGD